MKKQIILSCLVLSLFLGTNDLQAQEPYLGQIKMFAGDFPPRGWAFCDGQLLSVNQNDALFSLIGTIYGGDGRTTFALPDLRGRVPIAAGSGPGLSPRPIGQRSGQENVALTANQIPSHNHVITTTPQIAVSTIPGTEIDANGNVIANRTSAFNPSATPGDNLAGVNFEVNVANSGGNQSHANIQPSLGIHYIIALVGIYPSRN